MGSAFQQWNARLCTERSAAADDDEDEEEDDDDEDEEEAHGHAHGHGHGHAMVDPRTLRKLQQRGVNVSDLIAPVRAARTARPSAWVPVQEVLASRCRSMTGRGGAGGGRQAPADIRASAGG